MKTAHKITILLVFCCILPAIHLINFIFHGQISILLAFAWFATGVVPFVLVLVYRKRLPFVSLLGTLSVFFLFFCFEIGFRVGPLNYRFLPNGLSQEYETHPFLFWKPKNDQSFANDKESSHERSYSTDIPFAWSDIDQRNERNVFRIIVMGGSNAAGSGIALYEDTLTGRLEQMIQVHYPDREFEFLCAAMHGYCLFQNLVLYKLVIRDYEPDMIVLYSNINEGNHGTAFYTYRELFKMRSGVDIADLWITEFEFPKSRSILYGMQNGLGKLRTYGAMTQFLIDTRRELLSAIERKGFSKYCNPIEDYEQNLRDLIEMTKSDQAFLILADPYKPAKWQNGDYDEEKYNAARVMRETARDFSTPFVPVHDTLSNRFTPGQIIQANDPYHINEKGHEEAAKLIFQQIIQNNLLETSH
jgi:GDSL-like Lipase/Acylhydrolase family